MLHANNAWAKDLSPVHVIAMNLPQECLEVLDALSTNCRLESLTLAVGTIVTKEDLYSVKARDTDLEVLANIVARAFKMKKFVLKSWPLYRNMKGINILQVRMFFCSVRVGWYLELDGGRMIMVFKLISVGNTFLIWDHVLLHVSYS